MSKIIQLKDKNNINLYPNILDYAYPVGRVIIDTVNRNPSTYLGGTWVVFGQGRVLVGVDTNQAEFNTVLKTGGEKTHKLTENELASHSHYFKEGGRPLYWDSGLDPMGGLTEGKNVQYTWSSYTKYTGGDQPHNNLQPYITVYFFKRTA